MRKIPTLVVASTTALTLALSACSGNGTTDAEGSSTPQAASSSPMTEEMQPSSSSPAPQGSQPVDDGNAAPSSELAEKLLLGEHAGITLETSAQTPDFSGIREGATVEPADCMSPTAPEDTVGSGGISTDGTMTGGVILTDASYTSMLKDYVTRCPNLSVTMTGLSGTQTRELVEVSVDGAENVYGIDEVGETTINDRTYGVRSYYVVGVVSGTTVMVLLTAQDGSTPPDPEIAKTLFEEQRDALRS